MKKITLLFATILKKNWIELFSLQTNCYITFFFSKLLQSMRNLKMKMGALQYIAPCSLARVDRRFRGAYCIHHQVRNGDYTALYIPEGSHLHTRRRENLKYQPKMFTWNTSQSNLRTFNICRADLQHKIHFLQYAIDACLRKIDETLERCRNAFSLIGTLLISHKLTLSLKTLRNLLPLPGIEPWLLYLLSPLRFRRWAAERLYHSFLR
jgi:hypothetical protein